MKIVLRTRVGEAAVNINYYMLALKDLAKCSIFLHAVGKTALSFYKVAAQQKNDSDAKFNHQYLRIRKLLIKASYKLVVLSFIRTFSL
jgi:hypothetical protein